MPNIDVHVLRSGRRIGLAEARPVRITPDGSGGVVYRGKVFPVCRSGEDTYAVDVGGTCYSADQRVCKLATPAEARRLLRSAVRVAPAVQSPQRPVTGAARKNEKASAIKVTEPASTPALVEILGLLSIAVPATAKPSDRDR